MYSNYLQDLLHRSDERVREARAMTTAARHRARQAAKDRIVDPVALHRLLFLLMEEMENVEELLQKADIDIELGLELSGPVNKKRPSPDDVRRRMERNQ